MIGKVLAGVDVKVLGGDDVCIVGVAREEFGDPPRDFGTAGHSQ
jgi:hypothetical protein